MTETVRGHEYLPPTPKPEPLPSGQPTSAKDWGTARGAGGMAGKAALCGSHPSETPALLLIQLPAMCLGRPRNMARIRGPLPTMWETWMKTGFWPQPGSALAVMAIWGRPGR